ncbi:MAG: hypothetical protein HYX92_17730 [Chloroflexi bacterium]|nr:hypothetical protein [Chloroflexota bacterium]
MQTEQRKPDGVRAASDAVQVEVLNPVAEVRPKTAMPARRLDTLSGKRIGLWWDTKSHGDLALNAAAEAIQRNFQDVSFTFFTRQWIHAPVDYNVVKEGNCDAVIAASAD